MGPRNIVGGVVIFGLTLYYGGLATLLPKRTTTDAPGPHFFPYLITISILALSAMLIFQGVRGLKGSNGLADLRPERPSSNENFSIARAAAGLLLTGTLFFRAFLIRVLLVYARLLRRSHVGDGRAPPAGSPGACDCRSHVLVLPVPRPVSASPAKGKLFRMTPYER